MYTRSKQVRVQVLGADSGDVLRVAEAIKELFPGCGVSEPRINQRDPGIHIFLFVVLKEGS